MDARIAFIAGVVVGGFVMRFAMKEKVDRLVREEVEAYKEESKKHFDIKIQDEINEYKKGFEKRQEEVKTEVTENKSEEIDKRPIPSFISPFEDIDDEIGEYEMISINECGAMDMYTTVQYQYYEGDKVLVDENWDRASFGHIDVDIDDLFLDEDTDIVCLKNDFLRMYYEIIRCEGSYSDVVVERPHLEGLHEKKLTNS